MNTVVLEDTPAGKVPVDVLAKMAEGRVLFLNGELDSAKGVDLVATLLHLNSLKVKDPTITIFLNAHGGDARDALMIADFMRSIDSPIRVVCSGAASGSPTILLAAADESKMTTNSLISFGPMNMQPNRHQVKSAEEYIKRAAIDSRRALTIVAKKIGKSLKETSEYFSKDIHLSAKDALKLGLVDSISKEKK